MADRTQLCTFYLGDLFVGVDVRNVQEVLRYQEMTRVPLAPPAVSGLINLRGVIVTAVDLRQCFQLEPRPAGTLPMNVVVFGEDESVSLLVDRIGDVHTVNHDRFDSPPETLSGPTRQLIRGVHQLDQQLILVLDVERTLQMCA